MERAETGEIRRPEDMAGDVIAVLDLRVAAPGPVDVRGVVFRDDAILLVRERSDGLWTLPGGWADIGESAGEAVAREVWE